MSGGRRLRRPLSAAALCALLSSGFRVSGLVPWAGGGASGVRCRPETFVGTRRCLYGAIERGGQQNQFALGFFEFRSAVGASLAVPTERSEPGGGPIFVGLLR